MIGLSGYWYIACPAARLRKRPLAVTVLEFELGRLAAACERHSRWEFLFSFAPLRVKGGTGSPVNPIAHF
ncbi:MAG: hypothetical protein AAEJ52_08775 [Myxococcota bacterium]